MSIVSVWYTKNWLWVLTNFFFFRISNKIDQLQSLTSSFFFFSSFLSILIFIIIIIISDSVCLVSFSSFFFFFGSWFWYFLNLSTYLDSIFQFSRLDHHHRAGLLLQQQQHQQQTLTHFKQIKTPHITPVSLREWDFGEVGVQHVFIWFQLRDYLRVMINFACFLVGQRQRDETMRWVVDQCWLICLLSSCFLFCFVYKEL